MSLSQEARLSPGLLKGLSGRAISGKDLDGIRALGPLRVILRVPKSVTATNGQPSLG